MPDGPWIPARRSAKYWSIPTGQVARCASSLVIVGEPTCDAHAKAYLEELRAQFSPPVTDQQFDLNKGVLV